MSEQNEHPNPPASERGSAGVLSNLPRTRPQRASARRLAARDGVAAQRTATRGPSEAKEPASAGSPATAATSADAEKAARKRKTAGGANARAAGATAARPARKAPPARPRTTAGRAPRQGFESDGDSTTGPVLPPGGAELLAAAGGLVTEVAKSGLSRGTSTLKGILGRLHLS